jgi:starch synthase
MKGGILFSEALNAVSPQYAREIQTPEMDTAWTAPPVARRGLVGILNGVDYDERDRAPPPHRRGRTGQGPGGQGGCKADLLRASASPGTLTCRWWASSPGCPPEGLDIVVGAWYLLQRPCWPLVVLARGAGVQDGLSALAARAPDRVAVRSVYDEALAHKVVAGADVFPTLSRRARRPHQMQSRAGTVPGWGHRRARGYRGVVGRPRVRRRLPL